MAKKIKTWKERKEDCEKDMKKKNKKKKIKTRNA